LGANDDDTPTSKPSQKLELAIPKGEEGLAIVPGLENGWDSFTIGCTNESFPKRQFTFQIQRQRPTKAPSKRGERNNKERKREREREPKKLVGARSTKTQSELQILFSSF
jgi:hypothetical protein